MPWEIKWAPGGKEALQGVIQEIMDKLESLPLRCENCLWVFQTEGEALVCPNCKESPDYDPPECPEHMGNGQGWNECPICDDMDQEYSEKHPESALLAPVEIQGGEK